MSSSTNNTAVSSSSGHVDNLIQYVNDVKPYHTKLTGVVERYFFSDTVNLSFADTVSARTNIAMGYDGGEYDVFPYETDFASENINLTKIDFPFYLGNFIGLKIPGATAAYPELRAVNNWIPLEFDYFKINNTLETVAKNAAYIKAYTADRSKLVLTIYKIGVSPNTSGTTAKVVYDPDFDQAYLRDTQGNSKEFSFKQFINEILLEPLDDGRGAAIQAFASFDPLLSPSISPSEAARAVFSESLTITESVPGSTLAECHSLTYKTGVPTTITTAAKSYIVNHKMTSTPTVVIESLDNPGEYAMVEPNIAASTVHPGAINRKSFEFSLPAGFTVPFTLLLS